MDTTNLKGTFCQGGRHQRSTADHQLWGRQSSLPTLQIYMKNFFSQVLEAREWGAQSLGE